MPRFPVLAFKRGERPERAVLAELAAVLALLIGGEHESPTGPGAPMGRGHTTTTVNASGRIETPEGSPPADLDRAIQRYFPRDVWTDAARVSYYESSWRFDAERNTLARAGGRCNVPIGTLSDGTPIISEDSIGYYQINLCAHGHDRAYWLDADNNVRKAADLYNANGWRDWTVTARKLGLLGG